MVSVLEGQISIFDLPVIETKEKAKNLIKRNKEVLERDCLSCSNSYSEECENGKNDRLHCCVKDKYVKEDEVCEEYV